MEIGVEWLTLIMLGSMLLLMVAGMPIAFVLLFLAGVGFWILRGPNSVGSLASIAVTAITRDVLLALPTFIFMAVVLEISGLGGAIYEMMYKWMARLRGGLAMGTIAASAIMAAMTGSSATATITMGIIAYPQMEKRGYDKRLIIGVIPAGGSLGPLIPPSIPMIVVAMFTTVSIGRLFISGIFPGLLATFGFMAYIAIRCWIDPKIGPAIPEAERPSWGEKFKSLRLSILPILLIFLVLGLIYLGISTPSEAGGIGAFGGLIVAAINRNLTFRNLQQALTTSIRITAMLFWLIFCGGAFSQLLGIIGVQSYIKEAILGLEVSSFIVLIGMLGLVYILGMFIDGGPLAVILLPVFFPVVLALGIDPLWFALLFSMEILIGALTPPFGMTLFFFKGLNIPGVSMADIYRSIIPFVMVITAVFILVILFPELATWLPNQMIR